MPKLPTITTTERIVDKVPHWLPLTCLRKTEEGFWCLKTANENGVRQTDFKGLDDLEAIKRALISHKNLHKVMVGPIILCLDNENYFGLQLVLQEVYPGGFVQNGIERLIFPWSTEPKH